MPKIRFDRENCIGCGACTNVCSEFWKMGSDAKSTLENSEEKEPGWFELEIKEGDLECNRRSAEACPVGVIHIVE